MPKQPDNGTASMASDPQTERASRRAQSKRVLRLALALCEGSDDLLAANLGVSRTKVRQWADLGERAQIGLGDVAGLPPHARRKIVEWLASTLGCELAESESSIDDCGPITLTSDVAEEGGESARVVASIARDSVVERGEVHQLREAADRKKREARRLEVIAQRADTAGVYPLRSER